MFFVYILLLALTCAGASELGWLKQVDHEPFSAPTKEFELTRPSGVVKFKLKENKRVNAMAPVYDIVHDAGGKFHLVPKNNIRKLKSRFYQDTEQDGAFKIDYDEKKKRSKMSGSFMSGGEFYSLGEAPASMASSKNSIDADSSPYLVEHETTKKGKDKKDNKKPNHDYEKVSGKDHGINEESGSTLTDQNIKHVKLKKQSRRKRENPVYAVEILAIVDNSAWDKFYQHTSESDPSRDETTSYNIREFLIQAVNMMSLRYQSITDPEVQIYLTISGFVILETRDSTDPLPLTEGTDGTVEGSSYLSHLASWVGNLTTDVPNDTVMLFTDLDLFSGNLETGSFQAAIAYLKQVCSPYRVAVSEVNGLFTTVSTAAHELGHLLGAYHDGENETALCPAEDKHIMAPIVTSFTKGDSYTANPWTFSGCSIGAFNQTFADLGAGNCLLDVGNYYNETEYSEIISSLPGQLSTPDEQCQWVMGSGSYMCSFYATPTNESFCRDMACYDPSDGYCYTSYVPEKGTDCGETWENKYCIDGLCVNKSAEYIPDPVTAPTTTTTTTTTAAPTNATTTTVGPAACVSDVGYSSYSCYDLDVYFLQEYGQGATWWCQDPDWETVCCVYCNDACVDLGWTDWTCEQESANQTLAGHPPTYWCNDWDLKAQCCAYCEDRCIDVGWEGKNCDEVSAYLLSYGYPDSYWCGDWTWKSYCCSYCEDYLQLHNVMKVDITSDSSSIQQFYTEVTLGGLGFDVHVDKLSSASYYVTLVKELRRP